MRPWYLVLAMAITWLVGVQGLTSGCATVAYLREGSAPDVEAALVEVRRAEEPAESLAALHEAARLKATVERSDLTFPLGAARMLLAGLLVVASGLALAGRPGGRTLALQALAAFAVFALVDYALTRPLREAWIGVVVQGAFALPEGMAERDLLSRGAFWWWMERARLVVLEVAGLGFAAFALTRPRTRAFFQAARAYAERAGGS